VPCVKEYKLPLLPFEKELISLAGCTEDEYRYFVAEAQKRAKLRPAEYDHIPDIRCDPTGGVLTSILISLAVGIATTALSLLLAPKPRAQEGIRRRELGNITGQDSFAQTFGFDSQAQLANYNEPIPILFGDYNFNDGTGGILVTPRLVWSRALSYGLEQGVKLMLVVGEQGEGSGGLNRPNLEGIYLGNTPLNAAFSHKFAFYFNNGGQGGTSRILASNLRFGTRGTTSSGDPETSNDVFTTPTRNTDTDRAFCQSYSPQANAQFGAFSPVYNGTQYRINWKLVPIPKVPGADGDPSDQLILERIKIAGNYGTFLTSPQAKRSIVAQGQKGTGRNYSRRMGITDVNGSGSSGVQAQTVAVGNRCTFEIVSDRLPESLYFLGAAPNFTSQIVKVDDINAEIDTQCSAADAVLQLGETIQIGYTLWKVAGRSQPIWQKGQNQRVTLECIELLGGQASDRQIDVLSRQILTANVLRNEFNDNQSTVPTPDLSVSLPMRTQIGIVRNTRPCDATEIGIKSQVWNRANGLANFTSLPSPAEFIKAEKDSVAISSGTINLFLPRTSCFSLQLRPAETDANNNPQPWVELNQLLCITGDQPVDVFNFIRITHPTRRQYEFRLVPRPGSDVIKNTTESTQFWQLNAGQPNRIGRVFSNQYGTFGISTAGTIVTGKSQVGRLGQLQVGALSSEGRLLGTSTLTAITRSGAGPGGYDQIVLQQGFMQEIFGLRPGPADVGKTFSREIAYTLPDGRRLTIGWLATVSQNSSVNPDGRFPVNLLPYLYGGLAANYVDGTATGSFNINEQFPIGLQLSFSNPVLSLLPNLPNRLVQISILVTGVSSQVIDRTLDVSARIFEGFPQLADVSFYSGQLEKSNANQPEHTISYVNEITINDPTPNYSGLATCGLALKASRTYNSLDQLRYWENRGIPVQRFGAGYSSEPSASIGPSNLFTDLVYYLLTNKTAGAGGTISPELIRTSDFTETSKFLRTNKLFFDGVIADPINIREYITRIASFFLCNFVIADGLFSITPALPTTSSGTISTGAVPISALFTNGNIIEDSFTVEYINAQERDRIQAVMRYRTAARNQLPEEKTLIVRWNEAGSADSKVESFDLTQFCTTRNHALLVGKYLLSIRRRITHTVRFKTTPQGLNLAPGRFIRVITTASPYSGANNGVISDNGTITSASPLPNGSYSIVFFKSGSNAVSTGTLVVSNGATTNSALFGVVFTVTNQATSSNVYIVEQLSLDAENLVEITASEFPTNASLSSVIAQDVLSGTAFIVEG
jgi:hypothetical protein